MADENSKKAGKRSYIFTRETLGMTLMLFSVIMLFILFTRTWALGTVGAEICRFMYGTFGYGAYLVLALAAYFGVWLVAEKSVKLKPSLALSIAACTLVFFLLIHSVTTRNMSLDSYGGYLSLCYNNAAAGWSGYTFGGAVSGILVYPVAKLTTFIGAYVIFSALLLLCAYFIVFTASNGKLLERLRRRDQGDESPAEAQAAQPGREVREESYAQAATTAAEDNGSNAPQYVPPRNYQAQPEAYEAQPQPVQEKREDDKFSQRNLGRKILFENGEFAAESYRRNLIFSEDSYFNHPVRNDGDYLKSFSSNPASPSSSAAAGQSYTQSYQQQVIDQPVQTTPSNYVYGEAPAQNFGGDSENLSEPKTESAEIAVSPASENYAEHIGMREPDEAIVSKPEELPSVQPEREFTERSRISEPAEDEPRSRMAPEDGGVSAVRGELPREDSRRSESKQGSSDNILSSLFGGESMRGDRGRGEERRDERSNRNLFDDDVDLGEDVFGVSRGRDGDTRGEKGEERFERTDRSVRGLSAEPSVSSAQPAQHDRTVGFGLPPEGRRAPEPPHDEPKQEKPKHVWKKYNRPPIELLDDYPENNNVNTAEIEDNKRIIVDTLANFKIESEIANVTISPAITRYDVMIADKTKTKTALSYRDDIALALMKNNVNTYLNYLKGAISIEVPNSKRAVVGLKSLLVSPQFINCKPNSLTFGLGKNIDGDVVCPDITKMPHLLVAGTTGSGKSICLSTLLISLLYKYGPEELRLILVDPKQAEFIPYNKLPHLMINEILYDVDKVIKALNWAIKEMERRYTLFKEMTENGVVTKTLDEYNAHLPEGEEKLPKILIVLDEFADLMMQAKKDIEGRIIRLAQKSRACGIHLILATQRPSVDCITGLIKSNLPTRIGFKVNSFADSSTIFDVGGAEKLLGKGDLYYRSVDNPELVRIQGCFIDTPEVQKVTDYVRSHNETYFDQDISDFINKVEEPEVSATMSEDGGEENGDAKIDDTFIKALKFCVTSNQASVSMIQRRFPVGYIKACKIIDWMENMNYITQSEGSKPRKVLMSKEEFINTYGDVDD